jgi:choline-glycine betaine transporter
MSVITETNEQGSGAGRMDRPLFAVTGGLILLFCALALFNIDALSVAIDWGFAASARYFGRYGQVLLLATFFISLVLCILPGGKTNLGQRAAPEFAYSQWASMIMCTLLAGGGVFGAAGEPIAHYAVARA